MSTEFKQTLIWFCKQFLMTRGRLSRLEYFNVQYLNLLIASLWLGLFSKLTWADQNWGMIVLLLLYIVPAVLATLKRYQDMGEDLFRIIYCFIPIIGLFYMLEPFFRKGQSEVNQSGEDPLSSRFAQTKWKSLQLALPFVTSAGLIVYYILDQKAF